MKTRALAILLALLLLAGVATGPSAALAEALDASEPGDGIENGVAGEADPLWLAGRMSPVIDLPEGEELPVEEVVRDLRHLTVANPTRMRGHFMTGMWGNDTSDIDVRELLHGYDLIRWNGDNGAFEVDPAVVSGIAVVENEQGDRSYILVLYDDLTFSDGTRVTAWDYAFSWLFQTGLEIDDLGGVADRKTYLLGYQAYADQTAPVKYTRLLRLDENGDILDAPLDADGNPVPGSILAEQALLVRDETQPRDENGEAQLIEFAALAESLRDREEFTLLLNADGELVYPEALPETASVDRLVRVRADGVIASWRYENGVRIFEDGTHPLLPGVRVMNDDTLMITVDHEYLPFFFELGLLSCNPYPISEIAPGVVVRDDGEGAYLANAEPEEAEDAEAPVDPDAPVYTVGLLMETVLDPENGYLSHPDVVSGPYTLLSFDGTTAEFELNPWYKGDSEGEKPVIERLTYTLADSATMIEALATGEVDLLNKVTLADTLNDGMTLMRSGRFRRAAEGEAETADAGGEADADSEDDEDPRELWETDERFTMSNYPRTGLSYISFRCDRPALDSVSVRQAIAWSMDRDQITREYTGGYGLRADGYYGMGQWMIGLVDGTVTPPVEAPEDSDDDAALAAYEAELAEWEELSLENLTAYEVDPDRARELLERDGWLLERDGVPLNDEGLREKDGVRLDFVLIYPEGNAIADALEANLVENLRKLGVRVTLVPVPMTELLARYYRRVNSPVAVPVEPEDENAEPEVEYREVDMIYLASNFDIVFDPSVHFLTEDGAHNWAYTRSADEELYRLALDMRHTEPGELLAYMHKWIAFQERFNETLPMIPIYTNVYFDFYTGGLRGYSIDESITWSQAVLGAHLSGEPEELEEEGEAEDGDEASDGEAEANGGDIEFEDDFSSGFGVSGNRDIEIAN